MSNYQIGFLYLCKEVVLIITYNGLCFQFSQIDTSLIPEYARHKSNEFNHKFYQMSTEIGCPILYRFEDIDNVVGTIKEIVFLGDIPIRKKDELKNEGYEIYAPFIEQIYTTNPCLKEGLSFSCNTNHTVLLREVSIFLNGEDILNRIPNYPEDSSIRIMNGFVFDHLIVLCSILHRLYKDIESLSRYFEFCHKSEYESWEKSSHDEIINYLKKHIDSFDITDFVNKVHSSISVRESYYRGEIDGYYYFLNTHSESEWPSDCYLSVLESSHCGNLGGLGFTDSPHYNEGPVDRVWQNKIKQEMIKQYSKEEHLGYLLCEWFSMVIEKYQTKDDCYNNMKKLTASISNYYHLDYIISEEGGFRLQFWEDIDKMYLVHERQERIERINAFLKDSFICNQDTDIFMAFYNNIRFLIY